MELATAMILAAISAIVLTIVLYITVIPAKKDGTFNGKFAQFLHDYFNFKKLYVEEVLKFIFVLATVACECAGVFMLISVDRYYSYYSGYEYSRSYFWYGLAVIVVSPIVLRLAYEGIMMFILAVKNIIEINNKLPKKTAAATPVAPAAPAGWSCSSCGATNKAESQFCTNCGNKAN